MLRCGYGVLKTPYQVLWALRCQYETVHQQVFHEKQDKSFLLLWSCLSRTGTAASPSERDAMLGKRKLSRRAVPTKSLDELRNTPTWQTRLALAARTILPIALWVFISRALPRHHMGLDGAARTELLALSNNFLAALGLLYAIYFGVSFQSGIDRLRELQTSISREASGLQSAVELSLTLTRPTVAQRAQIHSILSNYVDHVLSRELHSRISHVALADETSHLVISELYGLFRVFREIASNGEGDSVDLRTLDALHDEVRDIVRARSDRVNLTNIRMPLLHWVVLVLLSIFTVFGVAVNDIPSAPVICSVLAGVLGLVVPLSFAIVSDMGRPFGGVWSVSDTPLRDVRTHVLQRLAQASSLTASSITTGLDKDKEQATTHTV
jgi:hypothetical protein